MHNRLSRLSALVFPLLLCGGPALLGCATAGEVAALRGELRAVRGELRQARQQAAGAEARVRELDLRTEVHAFLQKDGLLAQGGHFPALEKRLGHSTRAFTFLLPSEPVAGPPRTLYFQPGATLRLDFVAAVQPGSEPNRLEVSARSECFRPLGLAERPDRTYTFAEEEELLVLTLEPPVAGGLVTGAAAELAFRFLPGRGAAPAHQAYVRVSWIDAPTVTAEPPSRLPRVHRPRPPRPDPARAARPSPAADPAAPLAAPDPASPSPAPASVEASVLSPTAAPASVEAPVLSPTAAPAPASVEAPVVAPGPAPPASAPAPALAPAAEETGPEFDFSVEPAEAAQPELLLE